MKTVLITGATGGIGQEAVREFLQAGWTVFATSMSGGALEVDVGAGKLVPLALDVTRDESVRAAKAQVDALASQGLDLLVNNAGVGLLGPTAELPDDQLTRMWEVNVRGLSRVTRAFAPDLCRRGRGQIINIGSLAGVFTLPFFGPYAATKHAVEALTDALRLELAPFGVRVSLIEPSIVGTAFAQGAVASLSAAAPGSLWQAALTHAVNLEGLSNRIALRPEAVARVIFRAATARWPRARYRVGTLASWFIRFVDVLPTALRDALLRRATRLTPGPANDANSAQAPSTRGLLPPMMAELPVTSREHAP